MKKAHKREIIFNIFSKNLKNLMDLSGMRIGRENEQGKIVEITEECVFCPLCMSAFPRKTLGKDYRDRLTIEHIPPQSVGGKEKILTCKICNENIGKELDHHIQKELNVEPFLKGFKNSTVEGKLYINDNVPLNSKFTIDNNRFVVSLILNKNMKGHYFKAMNEIKSEWDGTKFTMRFRGGNEKKSRLALLKSAYLEMFNFFGHLFLFNETSYKIREQIFNTEKEIFPHILTVEENFDDKFLGVNIIKEPHDKICFLVIMKLKVPKNNYSKKIGVLIPGPDDNAWNIYCNLKKNENAVFNLVCFPEMNCIKDKKYTLAYNDLWFDAVNGVL